MKTLILVDIQNDFIPGGALAVPAGDEVVEVANRLIPWFDLVVATQDWHPADHLSFASGHAGRSVGQVIQLRSVDQILWPDHCVQESTGAEFVQSLNLAKIDHVVQKGMAREIDSYSGFFDNDGRRATGLDTILKENVATELYVLGLATDYCVKFTVLDAIKLGYDVTLISDGCRGVDLKPGDVVRAIEEMKTAGAKICRCDEVVAQFE